MIGTPLIHWMRTGVASVAPLVLFLTACQARQPASGTLAASGPGPHTYATAFPLAENPVSENGHWTGGGTVGKDWADVSTTPGLAIGHQTGPSYTDATALLTGDWGADQTASATVFAVDPKDECFQEVELRLRSAVARHANRGYEVSFKVSRSPQAYLIIVRWNGALGDFTYLLKERGVRFGVGNGDTVSARIAGHVITAYRNGVPVGEVSDSTWGDGAPGMGFNLESARPGCPGTNPRYGFTSFQANDSPLR